MESDSLQNNSEQLKFLNQSTLSLDSSQCLVVNKVSFEFFFTFAILSDEIREPGLV